MIALPLSYSPGSAGLQGASWEEVAHFYPSGDPIRQIERASIRAFMEQHREHLRGRVLDFGAGKQPYRDLAQGEYVPFEQGDESPEGPFDAIMCNQVVQYLPGLWGYLKAFLDDLRPGGRLLMTYPTNWPEVEASDYGRFTKAGMALLLESVGFTIEAHQMRAQVVLGHNSFALGYGVVCRK